jgi:hypothetical protein
LRSKDNLRRSKNANTKKQNRKLREKSNVKPLSGVLPSKPRSKSNSKPKRS